MHDSVFKCKQNCDPIKLVNQNKCYVHIYMYQEDVKLSKGDFHLFQPLCSYCYKQDCKTWRKFGEHGEHVVHGKHGKHGKHQPDELKPSI